jgi:hypothetical protein
MTAPLTVVRAAFLVGVPVAFAGLLTMHPMLSDDEDVLEVTTRFQVVQSPASP